MKKEITKTIEFSEEILPGEDRFKNLYVAREWCQRNGLSVGQLCGNMPVCLMMGKWDWIAKWKNLTDEERYESDGIMQPVGDNNYIIHIYVPLMPDFNSIPNLNGAIANQVQ